MWEDYTIFDIETDGLIDEVTKIHCLSYKKVTKSSIISGSITKPEEMVTFLQNQKVLIGHNIICYDIPVLKKLLKIPLNNISIIDTLALSWYLYNKEDKHGLEYWGNILKVPKPVISDWKNLSIDDYIHRCETDVIINKKLWDKQLDLLLKIYKDEIPTLHSFIRYLNFKMECLRDQEEYKIKLDIPYIKKSLEELTKIFNEKTKELVATMPKEIIYKKRTKPKNLYKKDGSYSVKGFEWFKLLEEQNLPKDWEDEVLIKVDEIPGNPASTPQLKNWLYSLGWKPRIFNKTISKVTGKISEVPQVYDKDNEGELCESVKELFTKEPQLINLDQITKVRHRMGMLKAFLELGEKTGYVASTAGGFTSTLRIKHRKPFANMPKIFAYYGREIRGAITVPDDTYLLCGSDMSSLEDNTKQHYMYYFDPEYVKQMRVPGFDPHIDIAKTSELMTEEDVKEYNRLKKLKELKPEEKELLNKYIQIRSSAKTVNFAGVYGAGPAKIAESLGSSIEFAKKLHITYWSRNKAVKDVANSLTVRVIYKSGIIKDFISSQLTKMGWKEQEEFMESIDSMWVKNPISKFWMSLRYLKDLFSAVNQSSGVYSFDLWMNKVKSKGLKVIFQYHDKNFVVNKSC